MGGDRFRKCRYAMKKKFLVYFYIQVFLDGVPGQRKKFKQICIYVLNLLLQWQPYHFDLVWSKYLKRDIVKLTISILFKFGHSN